MSVLQYKYPCYSLLFDSTHDAISHLQRIQKYAAIVNLRIPNSCNITTHSKSLHQLPVKVRSIHKITCLCCHCHSSTALSYVTEMLQKNPSHSTNISSRSHNKSLLIKSAYSNATLIIATLHLLLLSGTLFMPHHC